MRALEVLLIGAVVIPLAVTPAMRRFVRTLPPPARIGFVLLFALLIAGHLARMDRRTFPFVGWWMYGLEKAPRGIQYERYAGITASGSEVLLFPASTFPSLTQGRIVNPLRPLIRWTATDAEARRKATALLTAVARVANRRRTADPVRTVVATRCEISAVEFRRGVPFRCREVLRFDLPAAIASGAAGP